MTTDEPDAAGRNGITTPDLDGSVGVRRSLRWKEPPQ